MWHSAEPSIGQPAYLPPELDPFLRRKQSSLLENSTPLSWRNGTRAKGYGVWPSSEEVVGGLRAVRFVRSGALRCSSRQRPID